MIEFQYDIIGKLLANRLTKIIISVANAEQSTFTKGQILNKPPRLNEIVDLFKDNRKKHIIFNMHFKECDYLSWGLFHREHGEIEIWIKVV